MKEIDIDTVEYRYTLLVGKGTYFSDSIFGLMWEILTHRFKHLIRDGKWMD